MNLLIVDDEMVAIKGMMDGINWEECGIDGSIWTAHSTERALQVLRAQQVDIMLCDIEMPGDNGIDLLRIIREYNKEIACIFLTCHAKFEYAQEAIALGVSDYILKPAPYKLIEERLRKVSKAVDAHKMNKELSKYHFIETPGEESVETVKNSRSPREIVKQVEEHIHEHLDDSELLVADIAEALFLNRDYLNRTFKKIHSISISQYLIQERMKLAAVLLVKPDSDISMVAEKVGYNNYPYFASSFKRYHGCTPSQYKKSMKLTNNGKVGNVKTGIGNLKAGKSEM